MNDLILFIFMINIFASLVVFLIILENNENNFIKWIKHSFEIRNWFGKLQICLLIIWMIPIIIVCILVFPIAFILCSVVVGIIVGCIKLVELGKK